VERFLQLSAEHNWRVANVTTAAQYFHLLRSQAAILRTDPRPLIVMTPKSLLLNPLAASRPEDLENGAFHPTLHMHLASDPAAVRRLVLASGKIAVDLAAVIHEQSAPGWLDVIRIEQLYPFPETELQLLLGAYPHLQDVVWLQEEPANMGAWSFVEPRLRRLLPGGAALRYIGRPARSSPAEGFADTHEQVQQQIIEQVFAEPAGSAVLTGGRG
ncbi:MAG: 2-oxoglutarate dehydrogenase E1 component, partial [Alicyclobacillus sp.]|nr:2-oxoglutarate dehydrogenase E1 component [Alicyclobacillus sp.]